ncbi:MAG: DMT family transporter [Alphaproteobacteria bacterium]
MPLNRTSLAKAAALYSGLIFGLFWFPLRFLEAQGVPGVWPAVLINGTAAAFMIPVVVWRWKRFVFGGWRFHIAGLLAGTTLVLYAAGLLYTEVVRIIVLYYMLPIWGFLLARIFLGAAITPIRWIAMGFGFAGLYIIFGADAGLPLPRNAGDWMGLCSGFIWAVAATMILADNRSSVIDYALYYLVWGGLGTIVVLAFSGDLAFPPDSRIVLDSMIWVVPLALLGLVPAGLATLYAPAYLNPGTVGLLFMTEISVSVGTAAVFAGEVFGLPEAVGVILISLAGLIEPVRDWYKGRFKETA